MESKQRFTKTYIYSTIGVIGVAIVLIALNVIFNVFSLRADLTEEGLYTLSDGSRDILRAMDTPVTIRFYYSRDVAQMPVHLKSYAQRVQDLLKEYKRVAGNELIIRKFNPKPDSDAEDSARLDGVYGQRTNLGEEIYLGMAINCLDETVAIPFLAPDRENLLEYDITRAVYRVMNPRRPVLGIMSSLPVMGMQQPMMMPMQQQQGQPPWLIVNELKRDFDVREVAMTVERIAADIDVLMLVHPTNLSDPTLFAIDQYILRGGKVAAFLDNMSMMEQQSNPMQQMQQTPPGASTLGKLLDAWGLEFDTDKVVADLIYMYQYQSPEGGMQSMPMVLTMTGEAMNEDDPTTSQLDSMVFAFGGAFTGDVVENLEKTVLFASSDKSTLVEKFMAQMPGEHVLKEFRPDGRNYPLAVKLTGRFETAFPEGKPGTGGADDGGDNGAADGYLKTAVAPGAVVLVGDSDMMHDNFSVRKQRILGQEIVQPMNDNLNFVQNVVEQLSGDQNLIGIRTRGAMARPFEEMRRRVREAEQKWRDVISGLEDERAEARRMLSEMQRGKSEDQRFIVSSEQMEQIERLREKEAEVSRELKDVRKEFRRDIERLKTEIKLANIALMPFLVIVGGLVVALIRRKRMVRK